MLFYSLKSVFNIRVPFGDRVRVLRYQWSEIFLVASVFTKMIGSSRIFGIDFDFIAYPFFIVFFVLNFKGIVLENLRYKWFYLFIVSASLFSIFFLGLSGDG